MAMNAVSSGFYSRVRLGFSRGYLSVKGKVRGWCRGGSFWGGKCRARGSSSHGQHDGDVGGGPWGTRRLSGSRGQVRGARTCGTTAGTHGVRRKATEGVPTRDQGAWPPLKHSIGQLACIRVAAFGFNFVTKPCGKRCGTQNRRSSSQLNLQILLRP
jgi:hypothetical protein